MIEHVILAAFLLIPLVIVVLLFSDEIIEEHKQRSEAEARHSDGRHAVRRVLRH